MRSCGGIGRHAGLRYQWETMRVRVPPGAPICGRGGMADTLDLGSSAARRKGSSPFARTILRHIQQIFFKKNVSSNLTNPDWGFGGMVYAID